MWKCICGQGSARTVTTAREYPSGPGINVYQLKRLDIREQSNLITIHSVLANEEESIYGHPREVQGGSR